MSVENGNWVPGVRPASCSRAGAQMGGCELTVPGEWWAVSGEWSTAKPQVMRCALTTRDIHTCTRNSNSARPCLRSCSRTSQPARRKPGSLAFGRTSRGSNDHGSVSLRPCTSAFHVRGGSPPTDRDRGTLCMWPCDRLAPARSDWASSLGCIAVGEAWDCAAPDAAKNVSRADAFEICCVVIDGSHRPSP